MGNKKAEEVIKQLRPDLLKEVSESDDSDVDFEPEDDGVYEAPVEAGVEESVDPWDIHSTTLTCIVTMATVVDAYGHSRSVFRLHSEDGVFLAHIDPDEHEVDEAIADYLSNYFDIVEEIG